MATTSTMLQLLVTMTLGDSAAMPYVIHSATPMPKTMNMESDRSRALFERQILCSCGTSEAVVQMPDIDGFAVLRELRGDAKFARVPIIALTASAMPEDRNDVMTAGFDGFITKPIRLPALRSEVERLLQSGYETAGAGS